MSESALSIRAQQHRQRLPVSNATDRAARSTSLYTTRVIASTNVTARPAACEPRPLFALRGRRVEWTAKHFL